AYNKKVRVHRPHRARDDGGVTMDKRRIAQIYLEEDNNCAETLLRAASEAYGLDVSPEDTRLIAAFGGGMGCGGTCGALAGALAVLGRVAIEGRAHAT